MRKLFITIGFWRPQLRITAFLPILRRKVSYVTFGQDPCGLPGNKKSYSDGQYLRKWKCKKSESQNLSFPIHCLVFALLFHLAADGGSPISVARHSRKKQQFSQFPIPELCDGFCHMRCLVREASAVRRFGLNCHHLLGRLCISRNCGEDDT